MTALRRHLVVSTLIVLVCIAAAVAVAAEQPRSYRAEARLAVAGQGLSSESIAAFPLASSELAADYARYVNNAQKQSTLEEQLGVTDGSVTEVTASPIPESNVVRIEVAADDSDIAVAAAATIGDALIARVNDTSASQQAVADTLAQYTDLSTQVASAEQGAAAAQNRVDAAVGRSTAGFPNRGDDIPAFRAEAAAAGAQLAILEVQQQALGDKYRNLVTTVGTPANLTVIQPATATGDDFTQKVQQFGLLGLAVGAALALTLATALERRRWRRAQSVAASIPAPATAPTPADLSDPDDGRARTSSSVSSAPSRPAVTVPRAESSPTGPASATTELTDDDATTTTAAAPATAPGDDDDESCTEPAPSIPIASSAASKPTAAPNKPTAAPNKPTAASKPTSKSASAAGARDRAR